MEVHGIIWFLKKKKKINVNRNIKIFIKFDSFNF